MTDEQLSVGLKRPQVKLLSEDCREVLAVLEDFCHSLVHQIESLQTENQEIKNRMTYLEHGLHAENERLQDENLGWRQAVDYDSEDYCSNEDSFERKY
ncbi:hypothetical protein NDI44_13855 [Trichocoleus sp. DQ-A3]|uniref:hypothetical protein n=1 Tax=Cyanophyceae TaxID=3028117 RepID=UPI001681CD7F|nr:hypothetical protein [Coleofasciculus sp. FACHB-125]MBD1898740.1 hypothetical protein [Coleofasciculus sp. FACHB-125]